MCSNTGELLTTLHEVVTRLAATSAVERGTAGAGDRIQLLLGVQARLEGMLLDEVAAFDTAGASVADGCPTTGAWLRTIRRVGRRDAAALVHQARQLHDLPGAADALKTGSISRQHAIQIVKAKTRSGLDTADFSSRYESILVQLATQASPDEVKTAADHLIEAEAPDRDQQLIDALADRRFDLQPVGDLVKVDAMIDKPTAQALSLAVEALSQRTPGDDRTRPVRRADAFSHLIQAGIDTTKLPKHGRQRPHLNLTLTLDQLAGIDGAAPLLARFGRIPHATVSRLTCDAVLRRVITDPRTGDVLDVGRASRHTTTAQNRALNVMYQQCSYPNCAVPMDRCEIHHAHWWSKGGPTDLDNLLPLCKHHHLFVHEYGYTIRRGQALVGAGPDPRDDAEQRTQPPDRWIFLTPHGTPIPDHRRPLRHVVQQVTLPEPDPALDP